MKLVILVCALMGYCAADLGRNYFPEENNPNFKRYALIKDANGEYTSVDLAAQGETRATQVNLQDITYYLYTRNTLDNPEIITEANIEQIKSSSNFKPSRNSLFLVHGWMDGYTADVNQLVSAAALKKHDLNVFVVDWSPLAVGLYTVAKGSVTGVGHHVGQFINELMVTFGLDGSNFIIIGHSLGAHVAGNAGKVTNSPIDHIIGLDPAAPLFSLENTEERLDPSDADYVQIIHTHGFLLGFGSSIGDVDYYPNGGMMQAGCGLDLAGACSHARSFQFLAESIEFEGNFTATQCASWNDFEEGKCVNNRRAIMGEIHVDKTVLGDYYLKTHSESPYALA